MKRTATLTAALLLAFTAIAAAQPKADEPAKPRIKVINITDGDTIESDRPTGELVPISVRAEAKSTSLIRIRHDFIDLILKAAEAV